MPSFVNRLLVACTKIKVVHNVCPEDVLQLNQFVAIRGLESVLLTICAKNVFV